MTLGVILGFLISQSVRVSLNEPERETFWYLSVSFWEWTILGVIFITFMYLWYFLSFTENKYSLQSLELKKIHNEKEKEFLKKLKTA